MAANGKNNSSPAENEDPSGSGTNWFVSIGLSVSQLFTGSGAAAAEPAKDQESDENNKDVVHDGQSNGDMPELQQVPSERKLSSNGEVPLDEESEQGVPKELANVDVRTEATRVHQGNTIRKKILFAKNGVTEKNNGASGTKHRGGGDAFSNSHVASMRSAQSYNQIESGSSDGQGEEDGSE